MEGNVLTCVRIEFELVFLVVVFFQKEDGFGGRGGSMTFIVWSQPSQPIYDNC